MIYKVNIWDNVVLIKKDIEADNGEQALAIAKSLFPKLTLRYCDAYKVIKEVI